MLLAVRVTPRGGHDAIEGWVRDEAGRPVLTVRVAAAAADGAANAAMLALLARALRQPKSSLILVSGQSARLKRIDIGDIGEADLERVFGARPT